jgi:hypothetical protein
MPDQPLSIDSLWGIDVRPDPAWEEAKQRLWRMTADERRAAMYAQRLSFRLCCLWSSHAPHEVPLLNGEFWFIGIRTPEAADATGPSAALPAKDGPCRP